MSYKIYWKTVRQAITSSKGRFLSIFSLMAIGAIALIGLKVTSPNMERTAQSYINTYNMFDLAVMGSYGLDEADVKKINTVTDATVEYGYLTDVTIKDTNDAVRIFSNSDKISQYKLVSGKMPTANNEIALESSMADQYSIGDTISFTQAEGGTLKNTTFTITGFVDSSEIWDEQTMGNASAGYGELTGYGVTTSDAFDSDVYMIARIKYNDLNHVNYYSQDYTTKLNAHKSALDQLLENSGSERLSTLKSEGQADIDQGYKDIQSSEQKLADTEQQLQDAQNKIDSGQDQINSANATVTQQEATLAKAAAEIQANQSKLDQTEQQLIAAKEKLDEGKATLDRSKSQLDSANSELTKAQETLTSKKSVLDQSKTELDTVKDQLDEKKAQLDTVASQITTAQQELAQKKQALEEQKKKLIEAGQDPSQNQEIKATETQLEQATQALGEKQSAYENAISQYHTGLNEYNTNLVKYQEGESKYQSGLKTYNDNKATYEKNLAQYNAALNDYNSNLKAYEAGLSQYQSGKRALSNALTRYQAGKAQIESAKNQIVANQAEIDAAIEKLATSQSDYATQKKDAEEKIAKAKSDLESSQKTLDNLTKPTYTSYTRSTLPGGEGYSTYDSATKSISSVGDIFPTVLYLVAAMVTLTTMTRFVDEERNNAGIFKALGYTNRRIIMKFVIYGFVASVLGTFVGIIVGNFYLSPMIGKIISGTTVIGASHLYFYPSWTALAVVLALITAVLPAYVVARRELLENPAQLLLAKPPVSGSKILLERISFLWKRLSFTHKVTARNIFRYKQRMFMTIFGVAGSVALLFAGLGIQSSISGIAQAQFGEIMTYDMIVAENNSAKQSDKDQLAQLLDSDEIKQKLAIQYLSFDQTISGVADDQPISLIVTDSDKLSDFTTLRERHTNKTLQLSNDGVIISEKLAKLYDAKVGDSISVTIEGKNVEVKIAGIAEMYAGHYIYMTANYYHHLLDKTYQTNAYLVTLKDNSTSNIKKVSAEFIQHPGVSGVAQNTTIVKQVETISHSLQSVMIILIVLSVLLAVVILYNLTNINVAERIRELSTIKVLGFHNKEVTLYIYRETITLSIVGIIVGICGGLVLHRIILDLIGSDVIMFNPSVALHVYLIPIIAIIGILAVLGWYVNHALRRVDMLEALKSVE